MKHRLVKILLVIFSLYPLFLFSQHQNQYPDTIVDSYNTLTKTTDKYFGGTLTQMGGLVPLESLFYPSDTFVSLPTGSYVVLAFIDNYIMDAPGQPDIFMEEVGGSGEYADIYVSSDNVEFTFLGKAGNGKMNKFDLARISYTKPVLYIKVIGLDARGASPGFDLRNVHGLPGSNYPIVEVPVILENVLFDINKAELKPESYVSLNNLVKELQANPLMRIEIRGHTDNIGDELQNQVLSEHRARSVLDYLEDSGISKDRLSCKGFGSTFPITSNIDEEGRKMNRRVEFIKME